MAIDKCLQAYDWAAVALDPFPYGIFLMKFAVRDPSDLAFSAIVTVAPAAVAAAGAVVVAVAVVVLATTPCDSPDAYQYSDWARMSGR